MKASHVDIFKSDLKRPNKYFFCAPIFRIPPDATNSVCSVSGALLSAMMHKCKRSTSRYSCKVTLNSVPWIESFVKAAISLQITAEGKTVDKKPLLVLGLITSNLLHVNWPSYPTDFFLHIFFSHSKWAIKIRSKSNMEQAAPNWSVPRSHFSVRNSTSPKFLPAISHVSVHSAIRYYL